MKRKENYRILLVEDDLISGFIAEQVLQKSEFANDYHWVKNGLDALDWLTKNNVELILLDLSMPVMDGFDVLDALSTREHAKNQKVVILTSSNRTADKEKCMKFECVKAYLEKPISDEKIDTLLKQIEMAKI